MAHPEGDFNGRICIPARKKGVIGLAVAGHVSFFLSWTAIAARRGRAEHLPKGAGNFFPRRDIVTGDDGQDRVEIPDVVGNVGAGGGVQRQVERIERGLARESPPSPPQARLLAALSGREPDTARSPPYLYTNNDGIADRSR